MATPLQKYTFAGQLVKVRMPAVGETVNSQHFTVPPGNKVVTIFVPTMAGTATMKLQALLPNEVVETTQTWLDLTICMLTDVTFVALDAFPETTAVTLPVSAMGGGILRWVASEDTSGAVVEVIMLFSRDG